MSRPDTLSSLEKAIRESVAGDSLAEAERLFARYTAEAERLARALPAGAADLAALADRTRILFEWAGAMMQASRSYAAHELAQVQLLAQYRKYANYLRIRAEA